VIKPWGANHRPFISAKARRCIGNSVSLCGMLALSACSLPSPSPVNCQSFAQVPYTITQPGAYCLRGDVKFRSNLHKSSAAITIASQQVVLDLGGHELSGDGHGIGIASENFGAITVQNGHVANFDKGIVLVNRRETLASHQYELHNLHFKNNQAVSVLNIGNASKIDHISVSNTGGALSPLLPGFPLGSVFAVYLEGSEIQITDSQVLETNAVRDGLAYGIFLKNADNALVKDNSVSFGALSNNRKFGVSVHHSREVTIANNEISGATNPISKDSGSSVLEKANSYSKRSIYSPTQSQQPGYRITWGKDPEWPNQAITLAVSPDGQTLAAGGRYEHIILYDMATRKRKYVLTGGKGGTYALHYAAQGNLLISGGEDGVIRLWDTSTGVLRQSIQAHTAAVSALAISSDGKTLVSAGDDERVKSWDLRSGKMRGQYPVDLGRHIQYPDPARLIPGLAISPDSRLLAVASVGGLSVWNRDTKQLVASHPGHALAVAFSADGRYLVGTLGGGDIIIWDTSNWQIRKNRVGDSDSAFGVVFVGRQLRYITTGDAGLQLWDLRDNTEVRRFISEPKTKRYLAAAVSPDGKTLVSSGNYYRGDGVTPISTIRFWDIADGEELFPSQNPLEEDLHKMIPRLGNGAMALSPDGRFLLVRDKVWDLDTGHIKGELIRPPAQAKKITRPRLGVYSRDGEQLITVADEAIEFWDAATLKYLGSVGNYHIVDFPYYRQLLLSPDGEQLALLANDNRINIFDVHKKMRVWQSKDYAREPGDAQTPFIVTDIAYSPSGKQLAIAVRPRNKPSFVSIRSAATGKEQSVLSLSGLESVKSIAYSPDGRQLWVSAFSQEKRQSHTIGVFDVNSGRHVAWLDDHRFGTTLLAFSKDGKWLATAGVDKAQPGISDCYINVWDVKARQMVQHHQFCRQRVSPRSLIDEIIFSPDNQRLYFDGMILDWRKGERIRVSEY
jgi:WD40 repeat protein